MLAKRSCQVTQIYHHSQEVGRGTQGICSVTKATRKAVSLRTIVQVRSTLVRNASDSTGSSPNYCTKTTWEQWQRTKIVHFYRIKIVHINPLLMSFRTIRRIRWMRARICVNRKIITSSDKTAIKATRSLHLLVGSIKLQRCSIRLRRTLQHTSIGNIQDSCSQEVHKQWLASLFRKCRKINMSLK